MTNSDVRALHGLRRPRSAATWVVPQVESALFATASCGVLLPTSSLSEESPASSRPV